MTGVHGYADVLRHLSAETSIPYKTLEEVLFAGLKDIRWNQPIWDFSQSVRETAKTAIATINTDLFSNFLIPEFGLNRKFDSIVNSYEQGHDDKTELCIAAAGRLGLNLKENKILLIDDKKKNIDDFVSAGGEGYHYQTAEMFQEWLHLIG